MKYPIVLHKEKDSDYGVTIPDVPGCYTAGSTIEEAIAMAQEAIQCHLEGLLIDKEPLPLSSSIEENQKNPDFENGIWAIVDIDIAKLSIKSKRVNITIPETVLHSVDKYAKQHGESRSGLLTQAVTEYMEVHN
ncbi:MAG: type II toxin-antitoxin system HicB family antitoxin [SAR324 cluster bacterium]|jgi:predicted RNase H-like HicB family nuclease|nr:type II toxin-antitoxin system HicB family antitoxin [SAR324 cluster bacterium]MCH2265525.1 type II toxin-antitoxin system HicB family antitoxin [SAR324 cluster bacterium]